jgi:cytochrome c oxidase assembly protein subunit 15
VNPSSARRELKQGDVIAIGFGTAVAMWATGYGCRLPAIHIAPPVVGVVMLVWLFVGGAVAGLLTDRGWTAGALANLITGAINLLVLGGLLASNKPNQVVPAAMLWVPGSLAAAALLGAAGGALGAALRPAQPMPIHWTGALAWVAAAATLFLIVIGGLVTSNEAGLAVVDWPNSFGYNMFLYPLSRMTGGIFFEHAHRLVGSLVGLTTILLLVQLLRTDRRRWLHALAVAALVAVIIQGVLGGLRVTGRFTWSTSPEDVAPSLALAVVHGVLGQAFFALIVAIAVFTSDRWRQAPSPLSFRSASTDRGLNAILVALLIVQLVIGALQRHFAQGLLIHIAFATVVILVAIACGARAWGLYSAVPPIERLGRWLLALVGIQLLLGIGALIAVGLRAKVESPPLADIVITTTHQVVGALLLANAVMLCLWTFRRLRSSQADASLTPSRSESASPP